MSETLEITLLDLSWDDILFQHVLPYLSFGDCFNLRATSKSYKELVENYFRILKKLNITALKSFNALAFKVLAANCSSVRYLNLCQAKWIDDDLLMPLLHINTNLTNVNLSGCLGLTSGCLQPIIVSCQNLKSLTLKNCHWVTVECIEALSFHQQNLEEVDLTSCWDLGDDSLIVFVQKFHKLRVLCISNIYSVTDRTLFAIAHCSQNLEHLNVRGCWRIKDEGVRMVGEYCRKLQSLLVNDCHYITERSLGCLRDRIFIDKTHYSQYYRDMQHTLPVLGLNLQI